MYQFFINQTDEDAIRYLKIFTFLTKEEINEVEKEHLANLGARIGQKRLAYEVTKIIHGEEKANEAVMMSNALFSGEFTKLNKEQILELFNSIKFSFNENQLLEDILINIKAASSKREAREFIKNGAITVNNQKMINPNKTFNKDELIANSFLIIRRGKKNFYLVELN